MFLSPLTKLTTYFKTHCSLQRKWLSFLHCQAMVQTSNISVKAKRKGRELGTLPFKHLCTEALCWLTHRYTLLLPFCWQEESFSFDWSNTFWAYQEQRWIWQIQPHALSQGRGCSLKSIIRSWETSQAFSFFWLWSDRCSPNLHCLAPGQASSKSRNGKRKVVAIYSLAHPLESICSCSLSISVTSSWDLSCLFASCLQHLENADQIQVRTFR